MKDLQKNKRRSGRMLLCSVMLLCLWAQPVYAVDEYGIEYSGPTKICLDAGFTFTVTMGDQLYMLFGSITGQDGATLYIDPLPEDGSSCTVSPESLAILKPNSSGRIYFSAYISDSDSGSSSSQTIYVSFGHDDTNMDHSCDMCGATISEHTPSEAQRENEIASTCTENGSYDSVIYCSACKEELSRETTMLQKVPHDDVDKDHVCDICNEEFSEHSGGTATCVSKAVCEYCGEEYGEVDPDNHTETLQWYPVDSLTHEQKYLCCGTVTASEKHTLADAKKENETAASCTNDGSYESVVFCSICNAELSRHTVTVPALPHDDTNQDHICDICSTEISQHSGGTATCKSKAVCEYCGREYGEVDPDNHTESLQWYTDASTHEQKYPCCGKVVASGEHTLAEAQKENETAATCTKDGSYDSVVSCSICKAELGRESVAVKATGHVWDGGKITEEATTEKAGVKVYTCSVCGETRTEQIEKISDTTKAEPTKGESAKDKTTEAETLNMVNASEKSGGKTVPKTSDDANLALWIIMLSLSAAVLLGGAVISFIRSFAPTHTQSTDRSDLR